MRVELFLTDATGGPCSGGRSDKACATPIAKLTTAVLLEWKKCSWLGCPDPLTSRPAGLGEHNRKPDPLRVGMTRVEGAAAKS